MEQKINNKLIRCPRLGHELTFSYCFQESGDFPCSRIVNCWSPFFNIESFLKENLSPGKWDSFANSKSKDKVTNLIELIEAAKAKNEKFQ
jgi:hypothetical protein